MNNQEILDNAPEGATHVDNGGDYFKYSFRSRGKRLRSLADITELVELRKANAELGKENALLKKVEQIFNDSPDLTFDCCKRLFGEEFKAHNLEQQAKGVEDAVNDYMHSMGATQVYVADLDCRVADLREQAIAIAFLKAEIAELEKALAKALKEQVK